MYTGVVMKYRIGLDLGTNSIGWAILSLDSKGQPTGIVDLGSRIFHDGRDPKSGESSAVQRRLARQARRNRNRKLQRQKKLLAILIKNGFFPKNSQKCEELKNLDVYALRVVALDREVKAYELGRIFYHLAQRRGFKSGRKYQEDESQKQENKKLLPLLEDLEKRIREEKSRTFGEYLLKKANSKETKRNKPCLEESLHPTRKMIEDEFNHIITTQKQHHKNLTDKLIEKIRSSIFHQRPLKSTEELIGPCEMYTDTEKRGANYLPSIQEFKILQTIGQLKLIQDGRTIELKLDQKKRIYNELHKVSKKTFKDLRIKILQLDSDVEFNLESEIRKDLKGHAINAKFKGKDYFGKDWLSLSLEEQDKIVLDIVQAEDKDMLRKKSKDWSLKPQEKIFDDHLLEKLPKGYSTFSQKAAQELCKTFIENDFCRYDEAMEILGHKLGNSSTKDIKDHLPYYGEVLKRYAIPRPDRLQKNNQDKIGRISNPTVHIVLNQLRQIINALIKRYGKPTEIVVELGRDLKMNKKQKANYEKSQKENQKANEEAEKELKNLGLQSNRENIIRYKLLKELANCMDGNAQCPYTGKIISLTKAFSGEFEVEHILPFSKTLDDSFANKILACSKANQKKGDRSPFEAFGSDKQMFARIKKLPANKRWRFNEDAMKRFEDENEWLSRQLNDMRYMSKVAKQYLECLGSKISVSKGIYTGKVRYGLGLNSLLSNSNDNTKNRDDHRHHALDAIVIAVCSQSFLQKLLRASREYLKSFANISEPWRGFKTELDSKIKNVAVSVRPDHSIQRAFFEETAYGILKEKVKDNKKDNYYNVTIRKPIENIALKTISSIKDNNLRNIAEDLKTQAQDDQGKFSNLMKEEFEKRGIYKLKVYDKKSPIIPIEHPQSTKKFLKGYVSSEIHHLSVWEYPNGEWQFFGVSVFDVNKHKTKENKTDEKALTHFLRTKYNEDRKKCLHPAARHIMKLYKRDTVLTFNDHAKKKIWIVESLKPSSKQIILRSINLSEKKSKTKPHYFCLSFSRFKEHNLQKVKSNILGYKLDLLQ